MKINRIFHYLYCFLMGLPILIAPIFAIMVWSDNNYQPISITTSGYEISPRYETNDVNTLDDLVVDNIYFVDELEFFPGDFDFEYEFHVLTYGYINSYGYPSGIEEIYFSDRYDSTYNNQIDFYVSTADMWVDFTNNDVFASLYYGAVDSPGFLLSDFVFYCDDNAYLYNFSEVLSSYGCIVTSADWNIYDVNYSEGLVYDDTDIGSQLVYSLYKPLNEYFNFNKVEFFNGIYEWLTSWIFNGNPPLVFYIIWELLCYWLLVSIIWLVYDVLMYVPLLAHRWLDKGVIS